MVSLRVNLSPQKPLIFHSTRTFLMDKIDSVRLAIQLASPVATTQLAATINDDCETKVEGPLRRY